MAIDPGKVERKGVYQNEIGEALYRSRILSVSELARRIGVDRRHMSEVVNGHRLPSAEQLDAICEALALSGEELYPTEEFRIAIEATRKREQ